MNLKLKKSIFFVNSSPEAIVHLVQKALFSCKIKQKITPDHSTEFCGNVLKLDLNKKANQMGALVVRWDL